MEDGKMKKMCFFSDLHLFARRSRADRHHDQLLAAARRSDLVVLGGDIFDFKWSHLGSDKETARAGRDWIARLMSEAPDQQFCYLLGNHDCNPAMIEQLTELSAEAPQLNWFRYWMKLGPWVFLHGDVADHRMDQAGLERKRNNWSKNHRKGRVANLMYDATIQMRIHSLVAAAVFTKQRTASRVLNYLRDVHEDPEADISDVFFGHTHNVMDGFEFQGIRFHNSGAPIKGLSFRIIEASIPEGICYESRSGD
jgi:UDP-2,3-diacylglucosamine pyrophosphatase LpxH